jgi:peptidoglycan DL-endopeptidase CwlO
VDAGFVKGSGTQRETLPARWGFVMAFAIVLALLVSAPAAAAPGDGDADGAPTLRDQLDVAARAYNDAAAILDASRARQADLDAKLRTAETRLGQLATEVGTVANAAYRGSKFSLSAALLDKTPDEVIRGMEIVTYVARRDDRQFREYRRVKDEYNAQRKALDDEIRLQEEQARQMQKQKDDAAKALAAAGGGGLVNGVPVPVPTAKAAPRNADGTWPKESCNQDDPTTTGCITGRTLHALNEARLAGFTRFTSCYRPGGPYEHPKGRACDFSASTTTFRDAAATGGDRAYGDRLAGWCVANASRLGVLYVIWYRQIWFPGLGWRAYHGAGGAAGEHTNHVHLSLQ